MPRSGSTAWSRRQFTAFADIGAWSVEHPPATDYFITTGVQYALERYGDGFLVTDGHHNRVLRVGPDGSIDELIAFDNIVPTGLETFGPVVLMAPGRGAPAPPRGRARWSPSGRRRRTAVEVASGASLIVDVEFGARLALRPVAGRMGRRRRRISRRPRHRPSGQGRLEWRFVPVVDGAGDEMVLDRPTSLELDGDTAYVVGLTGTIVKIENL